MYNLDILISHQQIELIKNNQSYIELEYFPLPNSICLMFDEHKNIILYNYQMYNGYVFNSNDDITLKYIIDKDSYSGEYNSNVEYIHYEDSLNYLDCLIDTICVDYLTGSSIYLSKNDIYDETGKLKDGYTRYLKNLCGKCFIDWSLSEQIKNMIKQDPSVSIQINYWYHPEK